MFKCNEKALKWLWNEWHELLDVNYQQTLKANSWESIEVTSVEAIKAKLKLKNSSLCFSNLSFLFIFCEPHALPPTFHKLLNPTCSKCSQFSVGNVWKREIKKSKTVSVHFPVVDTANPVSVSSRRQQIYGQDGDEVKFIEGRYLLLSCNKLKNIFLSFCKSKEKNTFSHPTLVVPQLFSFRAITRRNKPQHMERAEKHAYSYTKDGKSCWIK